MLTVPKVAWAACGLVCLRESVSAAIKGYRMVFTSMRAVRVFLGERAVIKFVLQAAST